MRPGRPQLKTLTSLRFFLALHVLLLHLIPIALGVRYLSFPPALVNLINNGFVGVPFFFSLSGFVLFYAYEPSVANLSDFWRRRYARLMPAFYLGLALGAPFFLASLKAKGSGALFLPYLAANLTFLQGVVPDSLGFDHPAWSLSAEAFFYLTFPFVLPAAARLGRRQALAALVLSLVLEAVPQLIGCRLGVPSGASPWPKNLFLVNPAVAAFLQFNPVLHWGNFGFGVALARLFSLRPEKGRTGDAALLAGVILTLLVVATDRIPVQFLASFALLPAIGLVLYGGACPRSRATAWIESPLFVLLGEASYALYILHDPLINAFLGVRGTLLPHAGDGPAIALFCLFAVAASVAGYRFWETPLRRRLI